MRAREPDVVGRVERDGVGIGYEVHGLDHAGNGRPAVVLMPTWTIIHSRFWKFQVPYLARHHHVVTFDGPGNGASDRVTDPARFSPTSLAADTAAVMDECAVERAVLVGLSRGCWYAVELADLRPDAVAGLVLIGAGMPVAPSLPHREGIAAHFLDPAPAEPTGWDRYNLAYWNEHYDEFVHWFFAQAFSERHSSKGLEDTCEWSTGAGADVLAAEAFQPPPARPVEDVLADIRCPVMAVHGTEDRIVSYEASVAVARLTGGDLVTFEGSGHLPNVRDPIRFNLLLHEFLQGVT